MVTSKDPSQQEELLLHQAIGQFYFGYRTFTELPNKLLAQRGKESKTAWLQVMQCLNNVADNP
ncbi:hypothetical protein [Yersinia pekkanenii]|uniref:Uncharacterized protein n=1 Tax=Yersinia pekkanenii TaxID=1288385 RepID=A0A0T9PQN0_9GAMM|nr:hypothetical protein [Yersinia pekkanenii]CNH77327.1 Uncharacterised protein [Yersinia pekkanenii]CRY68585.1 Uncharacterised protein [Yersinia pekkanenii]